jgi:hypothetical protein
MHCVGIGSLTKGLRTCGLPSLEKPLGRPSEGFSVFGRVLRSNRRPRFSGDLLRKRTRIIPNVFPVGPRNRRGEPVLDSTGKPRRSFSGPPVGAESSLVGSRIRCLDL